MSPTSVDHDLGERKHREHETATTDSTGRYTMLKMLRYDMYNCLVQTDLAKSTRYKPFLEYSTQNRCRALKLARQNSQAYTGDHRVNQKAFAGKIIRLVAGITDTDIENEV